MIQSKKILLVDDEPDILEFVEDTLEIKGFTNILTASSGQSAISQVAGTKVDVIISDIRMPGMSGVELMDSIKQSSPEIEAILITGFADITTREVVEKGGFSLIEKPLKIPRLISTLELALKKRGERILELANWSDSPEHELVLDDNASAGVELNHMGFFLPHPGAENFSPGETLHFEFKRDGKSIEGVAEVLWAESSESNKPGVGVRVLAVNEVALVQSLLSNQV
ncbi:MAG: response regulator [Bdellovibrionales bacterium]|nr:response regulator [Bdellovibrionales bacterium]